MMKLDSMAQWDELSGLLISGCYKVWQMQYDTKAPEGFHVWFWAPGRPTFELVTHNDQVYEAIVKYLLR
jgi:hypothetical protein